MEHEKSEKASVHTRKSKSSNFSSSSAAVKARAAAEAAKVRAAFAEKEAQLKVEKARLEAELGTLALQREAAAATAQAETLEAAENQENSVKSGSSSHKDLQKEIATRTKEYVAAHAKLHPPRVPLSVHATSPKAAMSEESYITWLPTSDKGLNVDEENEQGETPNRQSGHSKPSSQSAPPTGNHASPNQDSGQARPKKIHFPHKAHLSAIAPSYTPFYASSVPSEASETEHLARYLARRDLVSTSLYQFDDKPENYMAWQSSFFNATAGLGLTHTEMLDLLIKWLGPESVKHIKRIRSVHVTNPDVALRKAWERLKQCYAAPEVVEKSLFKRLDEFPKI